MCTSPKQGHNTTLPALLPSHHSPSLPAHLLLFWGSFLTKNSAGSLTCDASSPSWPPRPTSLQGLWPQHGVPPYGSQGCSTLPSSIQPSPPAALHGGFPLTCHFIEKGLEKIYRKPRTVASGPSLEPTSLHQYQASRLKWDYLRCLCTFMAGKPDFG